MSDSKRRIRECCRIHKSANSCFHELNRELTDNEIKKIINSLEYDPYNTDIDGPILLDFNLQSGEITTDIPTLSENTQSVVSTQNIEFLDESQGVISGFSSRENWNATETTTNVDLGDFLSRPVRIGTFTWAESDVFNTKRTFNPWKLFFSDPVIANKLANYAFLTCDMKIKVVINASPFYYGAMLCSYQPLTNLTPSTISTLDTSTDYVLYSQRPHFWIYPSSNTGGEMTLPFFLHKNFLQIQLSSDFDNMGTLTLSNLTTLQSANGATGTGVTVQIYAWAEKVKLSGPSIGLSLQSKTIRDGKSGSKDEYGKGPVSSVASAIALAAGKLSSLPIIGPYMTATEIGATAIAAGASAIGFTNVPVIEDVCPYRPASNPPFSSTDIGYPIEKLTIDAKNELTIDPSTLGLPPDDELQIKYLSNREALLTICNWSTTNNVDDILFTTAVTPSLYQFIPLTNQTLYNQTPMCWVSQLFSQWRGDIIVRFKFVASQYHKGRLRLSYDPAGNSSNINSTGTTTTAVFTQIIDLGKDSNIEIRIPYQQYLTWLDVDRTSSTLFNWAINNNAPGNLHVNGSTNGMLSLRVLTDLTSPVAASNISILVFVRAADNFELGNPVTLTGTRFSTFSVQSKTMIDEDLEEIQQTIAGNSTNTPPPGRNLTNFGESIISLRQILRRTRLNYTLTVPLGVIDQFSVYRKNFTKYPIMFGFDPAGINKANGITVPVSTFPFNFSNVDPYCWIAPAFIAARGSMNWMINLENNSMFSTVRIARVNDASVTPVGAMSTTQGAAVIPSDNSLFYMLALKDGAGGVTHTNQYTQAGVSAVCPNYNKYRFQSTTPTRYTSPGSDDGGNKDTYRLEFSNNNVSRTGAVTSSFQIKAFFYTAIGADFGLHFFLNVPSIYQYASYPTPSL